MAILGWEAVSNLVWIGGVVYAFFGGWYWVLIGIAVSLMIAAANRKTAVEFVMVTATSNPAFKEEMLHRGVISEQ